MELSGLAGSQEVEGYYDQAQVQEEEAASYRQHGHDQAPPPEVAAAQGLGAPFQTSGGRAALGA